MDLDPSMSKIDDDEQEYQWYAPFSEPDPEIDPATQALLAMNDGLPNYQDFVSFPPPGQTSNPAFLQQLLPEGPYSQHAAGPPGDTMMTAGWAPMQAHTQDDGLLGMVGPWMAGPGPEMQGFQGWELPPAGLDVMAAAWASMQQQTQEDGFLGMSEPWMEEPGLEIRGFQGMQDNSLLGMNEPWMGEPGLEIQGFQGMQQTQDNSLLGMNEPMEEPGLEIQGFQGMQQIQDNSLLGVNRPWMEEPGLEIQGFQGMQQIQDNELWMEPGREIQGFHSWEPSSAGPPDMMTAAWAPVQQTKDGSLRMNEPWMEPRPETLGFLDWDPSQQQEDARLQMTNRPQVSPRQRNMWPEDTMEVGNVSPYPEELALDDEEEEPPEGIGLGIEMGLGMDLPYPRGSQAQEAPRPQQEPGEPKQWLLQQSVFWEPQMGPGSRGYVGMSQQRPPQSYDQPNHPSISIQAAARPPQVQTSGAHECPHCNRQFLYHSRMSHHVRVYHDHSRPFLCSVERCNMRFSRSNDLVRHYRNHHPDLSPAEAYRLVQLACQEV
ncbi:uncharacterized protein L3040_009466 [Drepanopeziza brunnea f. sp. 'multigermtubi']|uniref:uncharacterized protein n=1 Tax=Drepanopeziza brunnea f. sp. 'multigermtubi' TaxID=698441 RepID=UPI00238465E1|nr:hypothetical protein L3040_009466 [Drepanopeziza brunnea f. sp. 'multigermtubi']